MRVENGMAMDAAIVKHKWWRIFSPCLLVSIVLFFAIAYCLLTLQQSNGWNWYSIIIYGVFLLVLQTLDGILKVWVKPSTLLLWITEIVLIAGIPPLFQYVAS